MSITVEDFDKCCRLCLSFIGKMAPLFGASLDSMLKTIVNLNFSQDDGYPQQVCARCIVKISAAHNFRLTVLKSHNELTEAMLKIGYTPSIKTEETSNTIVEQPKLESKKIKSKVVNVLIVSPNNEKNDLICQFGTQGPTKQQDEKSFDDVKKCVFGDNNNDKAVKVINDNIKETESYVTYDQRNDDIKNHDNMNDLNSHNSYDNINYDDTEDHVIYDENCLKNYEEAVEIIINDNIPGDIETNIINDSINNDIENHISNDSNHDEMECHVDNVTCEVVTDCHSINNYWRNSLFNDDTMSAISGSVAMAGRESGLEDPILNDDEKDELPKKCLHCGNIYYSDADWKEHMLSHQPTVERDKSNRPMNTHHLHKGSESIDKSNLCSVCGDACADMRELIKHMKTHSRDQVLNRSKDRSHLCPYCGKSFKWVTSLHKHLRYHTGNNLYKCDVCSKSFSTRSYMKTHQASHDNIKMYECNVCKTRFQQKYSVKKHMQTIHAKDKQRIKHKCDDCSSSFLCKETLVKHIRTQHGARPFPCSFCDKKFAQENAQKRHEKLHLKQQRRMFVGDDCTPRNTDHDYGVNKVRITKVEYMCFNCEVKFEKTEDLREHVKTCKPVSKPIDDTVVKCKMCSNEFTECHVLLEHYNNEHKVLAVIDEKDGKKNITVFAEQLLIKDVRAPEPKKKFYIRTKVN